MKKHESFYNKSLKKINVEKKISNKSCKALKIDHFILANFSQFILSGI